MRVEAVAEHEKAVPREEAEGMIWSACQRDLDELPICLRALFSFKTRGNDGICATYIGHWPRHVGELGSGGRIQRCGSRWWRRPFGRHTRGEFRDNFRTYLGNGRRDHFRGDRDHSCDGGHQPRDDAAGIPGHDIGDNATNGGTTDWNNTTNWDATTDVRNSSPSLIQRFQDPLVPRRGRAPKTLGPAFVSSTSSSRSSDPHR